MFRTLAVPATPPRIAEAKLRLLPTSGSSQGELSISAVVNATPVEAVVAVREHVDEVRELLRQCDVHGLLAYVGAHAESGRTGSRTRHAVAILTPVADALRSALIEQECAALQDRIDELRRLAKAGPDNR